MSRKNPPKLEIEYPCIKSIKMRMKNNDEVSDDQVKGFDRRVRNSPVLTILVQYSQHQFTRAQRGWERYKEVQKELDRIEHTPYMKLQKENEKLKKEIEDLKFRLKNT